MKRENRERMQDVNKIVKIGEKSERTEKWKESTREE